MKIERLFKAALLGLAVSVAAVPFSAQAQELRVLRGEASSSLKVPINRAVVVEAETPFVELSIANPGIADISTLSDRTIYVLGRSPGRTTLTLLGAEGKLVMLTVRFAVMMCSVAKRLSAGIGASDLGTSSGGTLAGGSATLITGAAAGLPGEFNLDPEAIGQLNLGVNLSGIEFGVLIEALETKGLIRTLSEPNLTALSGQEANFLAGGEYPIPSVDEDGNVIVEFRPFGVELNFTPRVVDGDLINLQLTAAVSGLDPTVVVQNGGFAVNGFRRRETSTVVEMRDGESFAIAGLLEDDFQDLVGQVPWLGDIPVLGALFRSADYERQQSELVIIITPHLVTPVRGEALALPTDRVRPPSESELFLLGNTAAGAAAPTEGAAGEVAKQDFSGSFGYVME